MQIRRVRQTEDDAAAIWRIIEPIVRAGDTHALPSGMTRADALAYWLAPVHEVLWPRTRADWLGPTTCAPTSRAGGAHVANCGYMTAPWAAGRGVARAMCAHSLDRARSFRAMQYNLVVSTNERAVRLWESFGFETAGRRPGAFLHTGLGLVDAFVMYRSL
jgi:GNAT superfamily N-acetyltransferase